MILGTVIRTSPAGVGTLVWIDKCDIVWIFYIFLYLFCHFNATLVVLLVTFADVESKSSFEENIDKIVKNKSCRKDELNCRGPKWTQRCIKNHHKGRKQPKKAESLISHEFVIKTVNPPSTNQTLSHACTSCSLFHIWKHNV